ncbi:hypothetical protein OJ253_1295 [Cryptosporidium canis]|uniref:Uncharacterized protein n=1 Tax=Cryptosporidium canis TaxID=195482 RepID=A0A9D5DI20_9CRYT|nr:hypothetical protein OJ253_1295 [Cryptosporidium canis]
MRKKIVLNAELIFEIVLFVDSIEDIYNIASSNRTWFNDIHTLIKSKDFIESRESITMDLTMSDDNIKELDMRGILYRTIINTDFPKLRSFTIKSEEISNEELECWIKNCRNVEFLRILSHSILTSQITLLCSKMLKLRHISLSRGLCECNIGPIMEGTSDCSCVIYERKFIVRRPKVNTVDCELTQNGSILKYLDFYTQELK